MVVSQLVRFCVGAFKAVLARTAGGRERRRVSAWSFKNILGDCRLLPEARRRVRLPTSTVAVQCPVTQNK